MEDFDLGVNFASLAEDSARASLVSIDFGNDLSEYPIGLERDGVAQTGIAQTDVAQTRTAVDCGQTPRPGERIQQEDASKVEPVLSICDFREATRVVGPRRLTEIDPSEKESRHSTPNKSGIVSRANRQSNKTESMQQAAPHCVESSEPSAQKTPPPWIFEPKTPAPTRPRVNSIQSLEAALSCPERPFQGSIGSPDETAAELAQLLSPITETTDGFSPQHQFADVLDPANASTQHSKKNHVDQPLPPPMNIFGGPHAMATKMPGSAACAENRKVFQIPDIPPESLSRMDSQEIENTAIEIDTRLRSDSRMNGGIGNTALPQSTPSPSSLHIVPSHASAREPKNFLRAVGLEHDHAAQTRAGLDIVDFPQGQAPVPAVDIDYALMLQDHLPKHRPPSSAPAILSASDSASLQLAHCDSDRRGRCLPIARTRPQRASQSQRAAVNDGSPGKVREHACNVCGISFAAKCNLFKHQRAVRKYPNISSMRGVEIL